MQMQAQQLWQAVLGDMRGRLNRSAYENWLRPTTIVAFENDVATVAAANTFGASTLRSRYAVEIEDVLTAIVGRPIQLEFTVLNAESNDGADEKPAIEQPPASNAGGSRRLVFGEVT